jgi:hypothetical protein
MQPTVGLKSHFTTHGAKNDTFKGFMFGVDQLKPLVITIKNYNKTSGAL